MTPAPPPVDRVAASRAAVQARRARAEIKRALATGERSTLDVLDASADTRNPAEHSLRVTSFLLSIPHVGEKKCARILEQLGISPAKRLGGLGVKQRERLRDYLKDRDGRVSRTARAADVARPAASDGPALVVLAGPTAVGKGTVSRYIREHYPQVCLSVSATTRAPRPGEVEGEHYYFVDDAEFDRLIEAGELLEYATVHNAHRYGTPAAPVREKLAAGTPVLLEIDIQGARQVRERMPDARLVFLLPPSWDELVRRLTGRGTESPAEQARRLATAEVELAAQREFDALVVNDEVAEAARQVVELMGLDPVGAE